MKLIDLKSCTNCPALEVLVDIVRTIGERRLVREGDTRDDFPDFIEWADEFQEIFAANPNASNDYYVDVETFTLNKAAAAGFVDMAPFNGHPQ